MKQRFVKKYALWFLKLGITALVTWYLFSSGRLTAHNLVELFRPGNVGYVALAAMAFLASQAICAVRLKMLMQTIGLPLSFCYVFRIIMIGNFFNMVIPGAFGGDFIKAVYFARNEDDERGKSSGIVVIDRALGLSAIVCIGTLSIAYLLHHDSANLFRSYRREIYMVFLVIASFCLLSLVYVFFGRNPAFREKARQILEKVFKKGFMYHVVGGLGSPARNFKILASAFFLSLLVQVLSLLGLLVLVKVVSASGPGFMPLFAVSAIIMLFGVVPVTPGNLGWTELLASFGWSAVGSSVGAEVFLFWRVVTVLCSLPGGVLYLLSDKKQGKELPADKTRVPSGV